MTVSLRQQAYVAAYAEWTAAPRQARRAVVQRTADQLGVSESTVYRQLKALDRSRRDSDRRADHGTSQLTDDEAELLARMMARGLNARSEPNMPLSEAVRVAQEQGLLSHELSYSQIARQMRLRGLNMQALRAPEPAVRRVPKHPNHVHLVDVSVCVQWYLGRDGKRLVLDPHSGRKYYAGKHEHYKELRRVLLRYMLVDAATGAFFTRYYYSRGENTLDAVDFLWHAWSDKGMGGRFPFRGIPHRIVFDQGPAWKNATMKNLLFELGFDDGRIEYHAPGNAKASGAVEKAHDIWQKSFEGRMSQRAPESLDQLNRWALSFAAIHQAEREHSRHGRTRMGLWSTIPADKLIECPDWLTFQGLCNGAEAQRVVNNHLQISWKSRSFELSGGGLLRPGAKVKVRESLATQAGIRVWDETGAELAALELEINEYGYPTNSKLHHVWDAEDEERKGASPPASDAQTLVAQAQGDGEPADVAGIFDDLDERLARHAFLQRDGQAWQPRTGSAAAAEPLIADLQAREEIADRAGRRLSADEWRAIKAQTADGITRSELDDLIAHAQAGSVLTASTPTRKVRTA